MNTSIKVTTLTLFSTRDRILLITKFDSWKLTTFHEVKGKVPLIRSIKVPLFNLRIKLVGCN